MAGNNRRPKYSITDIKKVFKLYNDTEKNLTFAQISIITGISATTIANIIKCKTKAYSRFKYLRTRFSSEEEKTEFFKDYEPPVYTNIKINEQREAIRSKSRYQDQTRIVSTENTKNISKKNEIDNRPEIKKANGAYHSEFSRRKYNPKPKTSFGIKKEEVVKLYNLGYSLDEIAKKEDLTISTIKSILVGAGIVKYSYDSNTYITLEMLNDFRDNIVKIGDEFPVYQLYVDRFDSCHKKVISVKVIDKYENFVKTNKGDFKYIDLYLAYKNKNQLTSL